MSPGSLELTRYEATGPLGLADELQAIYLASHIELQHNPWYRPERFWERLEQLYAPIPDFELVVGRVDDRMVGYAFGTPYGRPQAVWAKAAHLYPELTNEPAGASVYIFREFAVHPEYHGQGYARTIHDALLAERPEPLGYLLVRVGNPARATYEAWGWRVVGRDQPFADSPVMEEMAKVLNAPQEG
ncbi:GNAT family N-acetyltransferase [Nocardia sp. NPDC059180]|uniref:GNAT family N-acetyltransferase n=1 Tax=Nocardia sp. NPDC059180 TaxID=3346761 RepID=UPI0036D1FDBA